MLKLFKKKTPVYIDLENYDYSSFARDMTEEELLTVNGGKWIGNSDESVAGAEVGDTLRRNDGTVVTITQADIDWAKEQVGSTPANTATETANTSSPSSSGSSMSNTPQASVVKRDSTPEKESSTILGNIARYRAMAGNNQIKPNTVTGTKAQRQAVSSQVVEVKKIEGQEVVANPENKNIKPAWQEYADNMKKTGGTYYDNIPGTKYHHKKARVYEQQALETKQLARELIESASYCPQLPPKSSSAVVENKPKTSGRWGTISTQEALSMKMQDYKYTDLDKMNGKHLEEIPKGSGNWERVDNKFSESGCLMQAVAKLATQIKGEQVKISEVNDTFDKNGDGCLSLEEIKEGLKTCLPEGKNLVSEEIKNVTKEDFDNISEMGINTYVLGKADSVADGDHWINLESYRINEYNQVEFFYAPTSRNDEGRRFVLGPLQEGQENSNFFSISRIQTYTVGDSMLFLK